MKTETPPRQPEVNTLSSSAETRLKEMSKKAKQKGKVNTPKTNSKSLSFNPNWFYIGMGVAGVVGISYLVFRAQSKNGPEFKFTPVSKDERSTPPKSKKDTEKNVETSEAQQKREATPFELNSF